MAFDAANDGLWDWDLSSGRVHFNPRWVQMLGYEPGELEGRISTWERLLHSDDKERVMEILNDYIEGRLPDYVVEFRLKTKAGRWKWILSRGKIAERNDQGRPVRFVGTHVDIDERKRIERALIEAKEQAEAVSRAKSEFLANISHELRTPMNAVIGMTALLLDSELDDEQRDCLDIVRQSAEKLLSMINDIILLSKIEAGTLKSAAEPFDLRGVVDAAIRRAAGRAETKGLDLSSRLESETAAAVIGDGRALRQVLDRLIDNAVKFTNEGEIELVVGVDDDGRDRRLHFVVRDTGVGVPADRQDILFDSFRQADGSTTRRFGGVGIGLAIAGRLVELMGGRIWTENRGEGGSAFHVTIPFTPYALE